MKKYRHGTALLTLEILLFLAMNWGGDQLASGGGWPLWLDSVGTVLCTYLMGPVCGAAVGVTSNLLAHILYGTPWMYALVSILIACVTGYATKKKMLESLLGVMTASMLLAVTVAAAAYPLNLILNHGSTGNRWGDAVIGFLAESGFPRWGGLLAGELYVEMLDKFLILLVMFLIIRGKRLIMKRIHPEEEPGEAEKTEKPAGEAAERTAALILAAACGLGALWSAGPAEAESGASKYNDYVQTIYSTGNGLPCGEANDIAMTDDGIMWIGTYAGLYRYNGREFQWMNGFDSVRNVNCLYCDEEGRLWIGTNDNGLSIMINEQIANVIDQDQGLPANSVKSVIKGADGYYYIGTTGSMQVLTLNGGLRQVNVLTEILYADHLAADETGYVAAVTNDGTLYLMRQGQIITSRKLTGHHTDYRSCTFTPEGELLAATTGDEVFRYRVRDGGLEEIGVFTCEGLKNIKTLFRLESGELFICADNGIACMDAAGKYERINTNEFNNSIDNMLADYQGNLWFTSSRLGLLRLAPSDFRDVYSTAGMTRRVVNTIVRWQDTWYFGTDKGLDAVDLSGKTQIRNALTERFDGIRIRCMIVDRENHLWVCTYSEGLVELLPDGTEYRYNQENGAFGNRARVAAELKDGTILAAGDSGLSFIRDHRVESTINRSDGKITSMVLSILEREDGTILVGTDGNGIAVLKDRITDRMLTRADGLSSEVILRLIDDGPGGGAYVVTSNGLCYLDAEGAVSRLDGFPYFNNYDIWTADGENLFVLSSAGLYAVRREELLSGKASITCDLMDGRRGLTGSLTANAWTWYDAEKRELYLPGDTGVFVLNVGGLSDGSALYRMRVAGIRMDGELRPADRQEATRIPREVSRVEILPEVINYSIQDPYVGYRLEGFENDWTIVPQNALGSIVYTNLPVGSFQFHLAVFDNNREKVLTERIYPLVKEKEIYDNSWFIAYILFVPMFVVFWATWLLFKRHEEKIQAELAQANRLVEMGKQTVIAIARTVDAKDKRTNEHSTRVAIYSEMIAREAGMDEKQCQDIKWAAQMHDIGKIAIPDRILNKDSRLTDEEYAIMKTHTTRGAEILEGFTLLDNVIEGAMYHHERPDGRGYPRGLKGDEIPLYARIIGVADAFDAMTANRVYRKQMDFGYVLGELEKGRGKQFDPVYVDLLLKLIKDGTINLNEIYHVPEQPAEQAAAGAEKAAEKAAEAKPAEKPAEAAAEKPAEPAAEAAKADAGAEKPASQAGAAEAGAEKPAAQADAKPAEEKTAAQADSPKEGGRA